MSDEFNLIQELTVGDKLKRLDELIELRKSIDPTSNDMISIMQETSQLYRDIGNFTEAYSNNINGNK